MHIVIFSHSFYPAVGGIEAMTELLATQFVARGHTVSIVTRTPEGRADRAFEFEVLRNPSPRTLIAAVSKSDVVLHNNPCLSFAWVTVIVRRPVVVAVRTWMRRNSGRTGLRDRVKRRFVRSASATISISPAIAEDLGFESTVISNSYRNDIFTDHDGERSLGRLAFVGRLVDAKGVDLLIEAFARLKADGLLDELLIVGDGPERPRLAEQVRISGLDGVEFRGQMAPADVCVLLNTCGVLAVPSRWAEPFGIVALEGIASGCHVVVSSEGGLPFAVGECGVVFPNGSVAGLVEALRRVLSDAPLRRDLASARARHLGDRTASAMGGGYLDVLVGAVHERQ